MFRVFGVVHSERAGHLVFGDSFHTTRGQISIGIQILIIFVERFLRFSICAINILLMSNLHLRERVFVSFTINVNSLFGSRKSFIHHMLVVLNKIHFSLELRVEMVLTFRKFISSFFHSSCVRFLSMSKAIALLFVLP